MTTTLTTPPVCAGTEPESITMPSNVFAYGLFNHLRLRLSSNIFCSPFGIGSIMALVGSGAKGKTWDQFVKVFSFAPNQNENDLIWSAVLRNIANRDNKSLIASNSIWADRQIVLSEEFMNTVTEHYGAAASTVDFSGNPIDAADQINSWFDLKTRGNIKSMTDSESIKDVLLAALNAIYFKGEWLVRFDPKRTVKSTFTSYNLDTKADLSVPCQMMNVNATFNYVNAVTWSAIRLLYADLRLEMIIVLPSKGDQDTVFQRLKSVEDWITAESSRASNPFVNVIKGMKPRSVVLSLPKFEMEGRYCLEDYLPKMGLDIAFTEQADFGGIGNPTMKLSTIRHSTKIKVDEAGSEASAATMVTSVCCCSLPFKEESAVFRADRPFVFAIRDRYLDQILFVGRVMNPGNPET